MGLEQRLQQRVRASKFADEDLEEEFSENDYDEQQNAADSDSDENSKGDIDGNPTDAARHEPADVESASEASGPDAEESAFADISFGALASAQASLGISLKRKRQLPEEASTARKRQSRSPSPFREAEERRAGKKSAKHLSQRSSKHAPTEVSSKKAVSRKRAVVDMPAKPQARDPRFSSLSGNLNEDKVKGNYAFLNDYRASEMSDLRNKIKKEKDAGRKEGLKKQLRAMEDRERAREKVEEERRVIREHRKQEKEAVQQGKKPFFLKQSDIKRQVLQQKFESMSEKKAERMMERRRKKKASKERKHMPDTRRLGA